MASGRTSRRKISSGGGPSIGRTALLNSHRPSVVVFVDPPLRPGRSPTIFAGMPLGRNGAPALQVVMSDQRRGAETFAFDLSVELERRGVASPIVALRAERQGPVDQRLAIRTLGRRSLAPATMVALRRTARASSAAVAVAHGSRTLPACAVALAGTGVPFVYRSIGDPAAWAGRGLRRRRTAAFLRRARAVVALWPGAAAALTEIHGVPAERVRVIPNGVPAERFPLAGESARDRGRRRFGLPENASVVGYVGSLTEEKNVGTVIAVLGRLPGAWLLVAGAGPERAALERQAEEQAPGRVRFAGPIARPADALAAADVVVLASRTEGMPGVLIEAGLSGRPVVATAVGAVPDVVVDGQTGFLVEPGDVDALRAGIERALGVGSAMGPAARARCLERFEIGRVAQMWADLLAETASA
jgi:glycosyltransferase involved in cell wall biosynthesis